MKKELVISKWGIGNWIMLLAVLVLIPSFVSAAVFMKYDGVDGESKDSSSSSQTSSSVRIESKTEVQSSTSVQVKSSSEADAKLNPQPDPPSNDGDPDRPIISGDASSVLGTEIEDIGVTVGGNSESETKVVQHNETDLSFIQRISAPGSSLRAVFIKFDDIKGDVTPQGDGGEQNEMELTEANGSEGGKKGNVEYTWKVEEGEKMIGGDGDIILTGGYSGKKPKEIVVVGSKVRGWDPETKEEIVGAAPASSASVRSLDDLSLFVVLKTNEDSNVEDTTMTSNSVEVEYRQPAKLFGFISSSLRYKTSVVVEGEQEARVKVKFPWYHFMFKKVVLATDVEAKILPEIDDEVLVAFKNGDPSAHARAFVAISSKMKLQHDTAMAVIRKIN